MSQAPASAPRPVPVLLDQQTFCAALLAACKLLSTDKDLSPGDAVEDVLQVCDLLLERRDG